MKPLNLIIWQHKSIIVLRLALAVFVALHGWARLLSDAVAPFGEFLDGAGVPLGFWIAWIITIFEIGGSVIFALGWHLRLLSCLFSFVYFVGILLVHYPEGWFVVGLGRNGMEYSVLLIICFFIVGFSKESNK